MTDREKVIRALENCNARPKCKDCPWEPCEEFDYRHSDYPDGLIADAIALLKAQEPNTRRWVKERDRTNHWRCSCCRCVQGITVRVYRYCPNCGAKNVEECEK